MERSKEKIYSDYLQSRSIKSYAYRRWLLYPRLNRHLVGKILDFGCGIGDFLVYRKDSIGADINQHNIRVCRKRGLNAVCIDGKHLPFIDEAFSCGVMDNVIEHIAHKDVEDIIHELLRVLIPGGTLLIGVPGKKGYASDDDHKCFYSESELKALAEKIGCGYIRTVYAPFYFPGLDKYLRQYCIYVFFQTPIDK